MQDMDRDKYKKLLNPKQYEAVTQPPGPLLIFAGAGSGKTRALTYRIAYLIERYGVNPRNILAVTFTNKAAGEMKERLQQILETNFLSLTVSTFHSFGARVLRENHELISYRKNFSIYSEEESNVVIKNIIKEKHLESGDINPKGVKYVIGRAKDDMLDIQAFASQAQSPRMRDIAIIYTEYQKRLRELNAFDFDDLIYWPVYIFDKHENTRDFYRSRYQHLLVDEFQDTNHSQYRLIKHLAGEHKNVTVVGDDDQSIYGWRGADITNIMNFEKDFPNTRVVKLEQNYRSTQTILTAASNVIANNRGRKVKVLWTSLGEGDKLRRIECSDEESEALSITDHVTHLRKEEGLRFSDFAILYRTNAQSRALEEGFRTSGIPYVIVGGTRFYERMEIKDLLAYLRVLVNPADNVATLRIINVPKRGIGDVTIERIAKYSQANNINVLEGCFHAVEDKIDGVPGAKIKRFIDLIQKLEGIKRRGEPLPTLMEKIIKFSKYEEVLLQENTPESEARLDNIKELVAGTASFEHRYPGATAEQFLEEVSLLTDIDRWDPNSDAITLMTLHAAKGLEFPVVFITGLEEGLFPLIRSGQISKEELEEERRLMYVGMTRAKRYLYLTNCRFRRHYTGSFFHQQSRFLAEIPADTLTESTDPQMFIKKPKLPTREGRYGYEEERKGSFVIGADVLHRKYGAGVVLSVEGQGENEILIVSFLRHGKKRLITKFANLTLIDK